MNVSLVVSLLFLAGPSALVDFQDMDEANLWEAGGDANDATMLLGPVVAGACAKWTGSAAAAFNFE